MNNNIFVINYKLINKYLKNYPEYKFLKVCEEKNKNIMQALYAMIDLLEEEEEKRDILNIAFNKKSVKKIKNNKNEMEKDNNHLFDNHKLKKYLDF